jgi:hypothetical protein
MQLHEYLVDEPAPIAGLAADHRFTLGREDRRAQRPQHVAPAWDVGAAEACSRASLRDDLELDRFRAPVALDLDAHDGRHRAVAHHHRVGRGPVRRERRRVPDRLDQRRFARGVRSDERGRARVEGNRHRLPRAERIQLERANAHTETLPQECARCAPA